MKNIVIIGAGQAGLQVAVSLRQEGFEGHLTMIGEEPHPPYQRPPLSKAFLKTGNEAGLFLKPESFYEKQNINLRCATQATQIIPMVRQVTLASGEVLNYDHLVLATGSRPLVPKFATGSYKNVYTLRGIENAVRLREKLLHSKSALVIGGGFIGLEFAAMARATGVEVTLIEGAERLMARAISPPMSGLFADKHRALGSKVLLNAQVEALILDGDYASGVALSDGRRLYADLILLAVGGCANSELAQDAGLKLSNGIAVCTQLRSSDPHISAIGDVCAFATPDGEIRLESVQAAVDQARHLAQLLMGKTQAPYNALPWFWSDQGDWKLQIAGLGRPQDEIISLDRPNGLAAILRFRDGCLKAVESVNEPALHMLARQMIDTKQEDLAAQGYDLKLLYQLQKAQTAA